MKTTTALLLLLLTTTMTFGQGTRFQDISIIAPEKTLMDTLTDQLASGTFYFEADWATPSAGSRINLMNNPNYLRLDKLYAKARLPFFGTVHSTGFNEGGIQFDNTIQEYETKYSDKNQRTTISFSVKQRNELYDVMLTVYKNNNVTVVIHSNYRSSISYSGRLLDKKDKDGS
jgi:hypothetical protein